MPGFCFRSSDKQLSLLEQVVVQGDVMTIYFNEELVRKIKSQIGVDISYLVASADRHDKPFSFYNNEDKEHGKLHAEFPSEKRRHHHLKHLSQINIHDLMHLVISHQTLTKDITKNREDGICFLSKKDFTDLYSAFEFYAKLSAIKKSANHLEIHLNTKLSPEAYLFRLKHILDTADESQTKIITTNKDKTIYYLPLFWLGDIGNAKKELAEKLSLDVNVFSPAPAKK